MLKRSFLGQGWEFGGRREQEKVKSLRVPAELHGRGRPPTPSTAPRGPQKPTPTKRSQPW